MRPRRVVVTGVGPITASGIGREAFWEGLQGGVSPIGPITRFDASPFRSRLAAEIDDFDATDFMDHKKARRLDRFGQFAVAATRAALDDASLSPGDTDPDRVAVQMGSALGGVANAEQELLNYMRGGV